MILLFFIGLFSGVVSGMGIGGGTILIPALIFLIGTKQHIAQSVNLLTFVPTAIIALIVHIKNNKIRFDLTLSLALVGTLGAVLGSKLAVNLPSQVLGRMFGVFLLTIGVYEFLRKDK